MKKRTFRFCLILFVTMFLFSCQRQNDLTEMPKSNLRSIMSFVLNPNQNYGKITTTINGIIDPATKVITLNLPSNAKVTALRPQITLTPWSTVLPNNLDSVDFSKDTTEFTVSSESGLKTVYAVVKNFKNYKYPGSAVYAITFSGFTPRFALNTTSQTSTFSLGVFPSAVSISALTATLEFAPNAQNTTVTIKENNITRPFTNSSPVDFTNPVTFIVKSEDGASTSTYIIIAKP